MKEMSLEQKAQRVSDYIEIQNLMSKFMYYHRPRTHKEAVDMFAQKVSDVCAEMAWGVFDGHEGIEKQFGKAHGRAFEDALIGMMTILPLNTPVIEIAGDGKTAKGMWISIGVGALSHTGNSRAYLPWSRYGVDFIKEDGNWKIWHLQVFGVFFPNYRQSWTEAEFAHPPMNLPDELKPQRPPTYHWHYTPTGKTENIPAPPEPYETWDGKSMTTAALPG